MKIFLLSLLSLFSFTKAICQNKTIDSLKQQFAPAKEDTNKVNLLIELGSIYQWSKPDTAISYGLQALQLAQQLNFTKGETEVAGLLTEAFCTKGNFSKALEIDLKAMQAAEKSGNQEFINNCLQAIALVYFYSGDFKKALNNFIKLKENEPDPDKVILGFIGEAYFHLNQLDSALVYITRAYNLDKESTTEHWSIPYYYMAAIEAKKGLYKQALDNYKRGIFFSNNVNLDITLGYNGMAALFKQTGEIDSSIYYAKKSIIVAQQESLIPQVIDAAAILTEAYAKKNTDSAFKYQKIMLAAKDSLFSNEKVKQLQNLSFNEQTRQQEIQQEQEQFKSKLKIYALIAAILVFLVITFFLLRSNRYKQKAYALLQQQKHAIEIQNAKAQTEAALERVKTQAVAMHNSKDIGNAIGVLFSELDKLGIATLRCGICIFDESGNGELWTAISTKENTVGQGSGKLDMTIHPMLRGILNAWKEKSPFFLYELSGDDRLDYYKAIANSTGYTIPIQNKEEAFSADREFCSAFFFREGCLLTFTSEVVPDEKKSILEKFASVSGLTSRRYLDLKQAEKQARELGIEAALERVRASAIAMNNSKDVGKASAAMFDELDKMGIAKLRCGVAIAEQPGTWELWTATSTNEGRVIQIIGKMKVSVHPLPEGAFNAWEQGKRFYTYELAGEDMLEYYKAISTASGYSVPAAAINTSKQVASVFFFKEGAVFIYTLEPLSKENRLVIQRFTAVFAITYRRYLDLKQFEEQTRKAVREASLDRVRAEIASMRSTEDLQRITPLMWRELNTLKVPFVRCGVFIVDEVLSKVQLYLSAPDGRPLGVLNLPIDDNEFTRKTVEHWRERTVYSTNWNQEQFVNWMQSMIDRGQVLNRETYQGETNPPESLDLYFVPFTQGMLYVSNTVPLTDDEIQLVRSLAESFAIAYARYEDFKKLEDAKKRVEVTLSELKSAQTQLVQSAKMASLGELTAGIAHEIQNPLNFVNNFSEVSRELLDEIVTKLENNNKEDAIAIANDVKHNLEKIVQHGQRADGIVKGMLQHSRRSGAVKEPTDINKLADEYLRLAYHGLKAKNKLFHATLKTDYDESIGNISIIPQDIGRAILNLITNAFYAVTEKKASILRQAQNKPSLAGQQYEPTVSVSTKKINARPDDPAGRGKVEIRIADNGNGIPHKILDKIFQPFFTTKPTGQGTGLGLSLSYDIVKASGGEIKVETKESEGAEFIIELPIV